MTGPHWMFVGLGNPGAQYHKTRHNAGFMAVQALADQARIPIERRNFAALTGSGRIQGQAVILVLPQTYMNESGRAVAALAHHYKIAPRKILLVYDDLDFDLGLIKLKAQGSGGSHNGVNSVIQYLGLQTFSRLRIGIGPRPAPLSGEEFVLSPFAKAEVGLLKEVIAASVRALNLVLQKGLQTAMNEVNRKPLARN